MLTKKLSESQLSDLASAIYGSYWSPADHNGYDIETNAILEFAEFAKNGMPYTFGDTEVSPLEFIEALAELIKFRREVNS